MYIAYATQMDSVHNGDYVVALFFYESIVTLLCCDAAEITACTLRQWKAFVLCDVNKIVSTQQARSSDFCIAVNESEPKKCMMMKLSQFEKTIKQIQIQANSHFTFLRKI